MVSCCRSNIVLVTLIEVSLSPTLALVFIILYRDKILSVEPQSFIAGPLSLRLIDANININFVYVIK